MATARSANVPGVLITVACLIDGNAGSANAAIIHVPDDYPTIQAALDAASNGDEIIVADGTYSGTGFRDLDFNGLLVTLRSASGDPDLCTLDCQMIGRGFIFDSGETAEAIVEGFTITNGIADEGGGFHITGANPTIRDCNILECLAHTHGGGAYVANGSPSFSNCIFRTNTASQDGGGLYAYQAAPVVAGCIFDDNAAPEGGALYDLSEVDCTISATAFTDNTAANGGAIYLARAGQTPTMTLDGCTFTGNSGPVGGPGYGGAIYVIQAAMVINDNSFFDNSVNRDGGAIFIEEGSLSATSTEFQWNAADLRGGAVYATVAEVTLTDCALDRNEAMSPDDGGGGAMSVSESDLTLTECTFGSNVAQLFGGALYNADGDATLTDCSFSGNSTEVYYHIEVVGGGAIANVLNAEMNLTGCTFDQNTSDQDGGAVLNVDGSTAIISDCIFLANQTLCAWGSGGAIRSAYAGAIQVNDCTFTENYSPGGGAIAGYSSDFATVIARCRFEQNDASPAYSGAITIRDCEFQIEDCIFIENTGGRGGAVYLSAPDTTPSVIANCRFHGNSALDGAALEILDDIMVVNCLFTANDGHAAVYVEDGHSVFANCTIWASTGYGLALDPDYSSIEVELDNSILWGNLSGQIDLTWPYTVTVRYCDVEGGWDGEGNIDADPLFADPYGPDSAPGTEDDDLRLLPGSPCIDAAMNTAVPSEVDTDLDGNPRFIDDPDTADTGVGYPCVDMGAYEYQSCKEDINRDGVVDIDDLFEILGHWREGPGIYDVNSDGTVDIDDIFAVLAAWGPCPQ
ncbi:MAG: right-handed parallel beta-helix repeat-containing protein [Phycisphaerales bacterium]|nr:MAG: right-handed parallel beta-helix repeat-containing protein [Phycisphaerales bacterium]